MSSGTVLRPWPGYPAMLSEPRRLHLLGILLSSLQLLKDFFLPLVIYFITSISQKGFSTAWLLFTGTVIILAVLVWGGLGWYRFTYRVENDALVVEQGVLVHKRSVIPRERIQSIDLNQGLWHRIFNLVAVQVETAGGSSPEALLSALTLADAETLRHELLVPGVEAETNHAEPAALLKSAAFSELFLFGATSGGALGLVVSLFSGALTMLDDIGIELDWQQYITWIWDQANLVYLVLLVLLALWLLTALGMVLKYGGFTLTRTNDRLQMVYGLLQRRQVSIPIGRIQAVRLVEGVLRQPLGYLSIYVESAGYGQKGREKTLLWPLVRQRELVSLLGEFLPEFAWDIPLQPLPAKAGRRYMLRGFIPALLPALPALVWLPRGELAMALPLLGALWGFWVYRSAGWGLRDNMLAVRSRSLVRTTFIVPNRKVQSFSIGSTPWQRRAGLLSFELDLASQASFGLRDIYPTDAETLTCWFKKR
ncbi:Bacterial membrane flanked domain protein [Sporotomaculum syntrophicum]|uniref:Bacterial membrane flanked domain protein n=1 Tax=Sporotomaculum syntrophicum TaxID=182264 RepID=A0A9D3AZ07_9FIRM|nr:PH domain-containing protein [Sporotomaculum syntrophicum]KAF1085318.1 Bacterial membrane flanked domain protein [Sporotomaculum syntrophicum]